MSHLDEDGSAVQAVATLAAAGLAPRQIDQTHWLTLPADYRHHDITDAVEKALPAPHRKRGAVALASVASLIVYAKDQAAQDTGYLYADVDTRTITAVFNDQKAGPGWNDHRACFTAALTPEARRWLDKNASHFTQAEFAEFIEDNFADLQGADAQNLLTVATTIQATSGINFSSAKRLHDGQTQLVYNENIEAKAGSQGEVKIPQTFTLGLRLFKGDPAGYKLTARLKYRLHGGNVKFWFELDRPERAIEDAFAAYVQKASAESGYTVLEGKAPGNSR